MDAGLQSLFGLMFLALGSFHFLTRDREPTQRSYFLGGLQLSSRTRLISALLELAAGAALLLTAGP